MPEMILNNLSFVQFHDRNSARGAMTEFVQTLVCATKNGCVRVLRTDSDINSKPLAANYPVASWRNDSAVDIEERRFFRTLTQKFPWFDSSNQSDPAKSLDSIEYRYCSQPAYGLGVAHILEDLAVSIRSQPEWDKVELELERTFLDSEGEIAVDQVLVKNASMPSHIIHHSQWLRSKQIDEAWSTQELWERREELFPNLCFCDSARSGIEQALTHSTLLNQVIKKLRILDSHASNRKQEDFDVLLVGFKVTTESQSTLGKYGADRTFVCPDGRRRLFSWHARLTPFEWRIHFYFDNESQALIIGYIGPHLPTVNYPT